MASCFNCAYRERLITEEPCLECLYCINWEPDDEELEDQLDDMRSQRDRLQQLIEEPIVITDIHTYANPNDVVSIKFGD